MKLIAKLKEMYLEYKVHAFKLGTLWYAHNAGQFLTRFYLIAYFHSVNSKYFQSRESLITLVESIYEEECIKPISSLPTYNTEFVCYSNFVQCFKDTVYALHYIGIPKDTLILELNKIKYV